MHFRWRTNPTVIAHYMNDADVPRQAEVTLKPNEVCVVLENKMYNFFLNFAKLDDIIKSLMILKLTSKKYCINKTMIRLSSEKTTKN